MCRSIHVLDNFEPPATPDEVHAAALQYVRKVSGKAKPAAINQAAFDDAVAQITAVTQTLLDRLVTKAPPRTREEEAAKAKARYAQREFVSRLVPIPPNGGQRRGMDAPLGGDRV